MADHDSHSHRSAPQTHGDLGFPHHLAGRNVVLVFLGMLSLMAVSVALATTRIEGSPLYNPGMDVKTLIAALAFLSAANALLLLTFFMNLRFETRTLKVMVLTTFALPLLYGLVLIAESIWRHL